MSLSAKEKVIVKDFFAKVSSRSDEIGAEALARLIVVYPQTKSYFAHWKDLSPNGAPARKQGITVMGGLYEAVSKIDDMAGGLLTLSELHAFVLRVDPVNFKILSHCIMVVLSMLFAEEFTPQIHVAVDKFLALVALALSEKYR
ncbi:hemoglobin subunit alpha-2-like [Salvelinus fontinalis]|uniref:Hemoglobin subunit alpha-2-like n=1 Tax=Salvelinus namaycush TaxID=8040 RepID=A0A8U0PTG4_SALNM|nr:hemoglobin subunit alpha-2-like [Salvelinus namaycush]XP_055746261.1 hemoglobin subunit alpha-2-like [Salvelinus fontinalis]